MAYLDSPIELDLLFVIFICIEGVEGNIFILQLLFDLQKFDQLSLWPRRKTYLDLEPVPLFNSQAIRLGNDGYNIDDLAKLLHHNNINRAQSVSCGVDEVQAAMDTRVLDVPVPLSRQLFAQVHTVLVFDILDNRVPAAKW